MIVVPPYNWDTWIGQFVLAITLREHPAEFRKTNEQNADRRKKGPKLGINIYDHEAD